MDYPFHDRDILVTACGRICMHRKKVNISTVLAGHKLGAREVDDGIWLVSFMRSDPGYIDLEQRTLQTIDNPFGTRLSPMSQVHSVTYVSGSDMISLMPQEAHNRNIVPHHLVSDNIAAVEKRCF